MVNTEENKFFEKLSDKEIDNLIGELCSVRDNNPDVKVIDNIKNNINPVLQEQIDITNDAIIVEEDILTSILKSEMPLTHEEIDVLKANNLYNKYISKFNNSQEDNMMIEEEIKRNLTSSEDDAIEMVIESEETKEESFPETEYTEESNTSSKDNNTNEDKESSKEVLDSYTSNIAYETLDNVSKEIAGVVNTVTSVKDLSESINEAKKENIAKTVSEFNNKTDDEYKPYPCFLKEDGITIMPYILIGKYFSSSSTTCNSIQTSATSNYSENGRANAVAKGEGYQLYDWMIHKLWQDLITCKMNNININSGTGIDIDSLGLYWSSYEAYIDGISHFPAFVAFSYKPTAYIDNPRWNSPNYNSDIYAISQNSGVIKNLGYNSDHPFVNYPTSVEKSSENIYYCDVYTSSTDTSPIISTIGGKSKNYGAFFVNAASGWRVKHYIRLCYRPINE